jgi:predicted lipoprotein with Yx(FWY)xxD motif
MRRWAPTIAATLLAATALAGCANPANSPAGAPASSPTSPSPSTVGVRTISGIGPTLVTATGATLYFADQDSTGQIQCIQACLRFWVPLTVAAGGTPTGSVDLSTTMRPDGGVQVLFRGKPLYTFALDSGGGKADGNGVTDAFAGTTFTWHAATIEGPAPSTTPSSGGGGAYRGSGS